MTREELYKEYCNQYPLIMGFREVTYEDWLQKQVIDLRTSLSLPPAEGAKIRGDADAILSRFKDNVRGSVVTCYKIVFYEDAIQAMYEFAALQQPTAEGADKFLYSKGLGNNPHIEGLDGCFFRVVDLLDEFAALHAQKIADKMVSERLREELIAHDKFLSSTCWGVSHILKHEEAVDEYLKSREK